VQFSLVFRTRLKGSPDPLTSGGFWHPREVVGYWIPRFLPSSPDAAAAWQSFVAKVDKPVTTKPVKRKSGEEVSQTGEEALAIVSTPKFSFVRVKIHDLIDDERGGRRSSGGTLIDLRGRSSDSGSINGVSI
jgi:hypothetical protein